MSPSIGQTIPLSLGRRVIGDFLHVSKRVPLVTIQKCFNLANVCAARQRAQPRPSWCSIFTKAYAKVVAARPELRRVYLSFPYERIFEYADTTADVIVEARQDGENVLANVPLKRADFWSLPDIDARLASCKEDPSKRLTHYRRARVLARFPRLMRRWVWWGLLNVSGTKRARYFGTFGVSSIGNWGADSIRPIAPWSSTLHHGAIDSAGNVTVRLTIDHRVLDGSAPAQALLDLEYVLRTDIIAELDALRGTTRDGVLAARLRFHAEPRSERQQKNVAA